MSPIRITVIVTVLLILSSVVQGAIIRVPQDAQTLQAAVDRSEAGDTMLVSAGRYTGEGNINVILPHLLVLLSTDGAAGTILDCEEAENSSCLIINNTPAHIQGFTFTRATNGAIQFSNSAGLSVRECIFSLNRRLTVGTQGAAILFTAQSQGDVRDCLFDRNEAAGSGAGVYITGTSEILIANSVFSNNSAVRFGGAALATQDAIGHFVNCLFLQNSAGIDGGAAAVSVRSNSTYDNCTFIGNTAVGLGGGLYKGSNSFPVVTNCIFWSNEAELGNQLFGQDNEGVIRVSFCDVQGGVEEGAENNGQVEIGEGIIDENPRFVEGRNPLFGFNDFYLDQESPCVDAGSDDADRLGMDTLTTRTDLRPDEGRVDIGFHYDPDWFFISGYLAGRVTNAANNQPVAAAQIFTSRHQRAVTDDEGYWEIPEARAGGFSLRVTKEWFNDYIQNNIELAEDETLIVDIELLHPELTVFDREITAAANSGDTTDVSFRMVNSGNGLLEWRASTRLREDNNFEPWQRRLAIPAGEITRDTRLHGVAFDGDLFYIAGAAGNDENLIYVISPDGELINSFRQAGESVYGMRDLEWDGEYLWGCDLRQLYGFTTEGEVIYNIDTPFNPAYSVAWDAGRGLLWVSSLTQDILGFDRDGNRVATIRRNGLRLYGLACWQDDPDGHTVYVMHSDANNTQVVYKIRPEDSDTTAVVNLTNVVQGSAGGIYICDAIDIYSVVLMTVPNDGANDRIDIWQLAVKSNWATIIPDEGELEGGEEQEFQLKFNASNLRDGLFEGEVRFESNAFPGLAVIPYTFEVTEGPVFAARRLELPLGWSLVSVNLTPVERDIRAIMHPLVEEGLLSLVKDMFGNFYAPLQNDFNNIEGWDATQGYWIRVLQPARLSLEGVTIPSNTPLELTRGWQLVAFYPRRSIEATEALAGIVDDLIIAKDDEGNFYAPEWQFSSMGFCREGKGYALKMARGAELVWGSGARLARSSEIVRIPEQPRHLPVVPPTGRDMSLLVLTDPQITGEIGVYTTDGRLVGSGVVRNGRCGIAIRGDDPTTEAIDGAREGEELQITNCKWQHIVYTTDGFEVIDIRMGLETFPTRFELMSVYPNPFNSSVQIGYTIPEKSSIRLSILDISGRLVATLIDGQQNAGSYNYTFNADGLSAGLYFMRMEVNEQKLTRKVILIR